MEGADCVEGADGVEVEWRELMVWRWSGGS